MPISEYFKGKGEKVAAAMRRRYGDRWERVFYATAKKMGMEPPGKRAAQAVKVKKKRRAY